MTPIEVRRHRGSGPVVAVLHGGPGAPGSLAGLADDLASLGSGFDVLEPLQRRAGAGVLTVERHVADHAEALPAGCRVVGHSWGAMLGLCLAAAHPDVVDRLVLVGCGTFDEASRAEHDRVMAERLGPDGQARKAELKAAADDPGSDADALLAERGRQAMEAQGFELLPGALVAAEGDLPLDAVGHQETWQDVLRRQRDGVDPASFASITCPVLMLHGAEDPHPGRATFEVLRRHVPQLAYVELPRCGHHPWLERHARDLFIDLLARCLRA